METEPPGGFRLTKPRVLNIIKAEKNRHEPRRRTIGGVFPMAKYIFRIFFGICLILLSTGMLIYNVFLLTTGFDIALVPLNLLLLVGGVLLTVFSAAALPSEQR